MLTSNGHEKRQSEESVTLNTAHTGQTHRGETHRGHHCRPHSGRPDCVVRPEGFMEPCLLLLLTESTSYGYDLISRLQEFGFGDNQDPGMVYRQLRKLERREMIESQWDTSGAGPARRVYRMTADGHELLSVWIRTIRANIDVLSRFLERYARTGPQQEYGNKDT